MIQYHEIVITRDITRFSTPEKLVSWSGLCPSVHQSGNSLYVGRMKDGNKNVRCNHVK